jgi:hypothetical protein
MDSEPSWERAWQAVQPADQRKRPVVCRGRAARKCLRNEQSPRACAKPGFLQPADRLCQRTWRMRACRGVRLTKRGAGPTGGCRHSWSSSPHESAIRRSFRIAPPKGNGKRYLGSRYSELLGSTRQRSLVCRWRLADVRRSVTCISAVEASSSSPVPVLRRPT